MMAVDRRQNLSDAAQENQSDARSPAIVPDRNRKALLIDHTTPLGDFSPLVEDEQYIDLPDVASNTAAARVASEQRRHVQTTHLRRFHRQICMRVNERVELERRQMQLTEQSVSDKMARLLETRSSDSARNNAGPKLVFRRESHAKQLTEHKASILRLQNAESMITAMEKAIRVDSQVRYLLLESTSVPRHAQVNAKSFQDDDEAVQANAPVTLPPKQVGCPVSPTE
ncbi:hypothetical protein Poli38472_008995 [Pythium oligandrum]|uniref:Uncharacterized protein n=1 Tax=Pythium oligandrum TaxID=41045 RepID=A0A8K1FNP2_PYTOL|nr:hypothetical protein Poli38472_008995 [Pythium oligandrum]|eukprot:TMW64828.1 hypothetical protein Poli38472_008995 [Pythium oligandrum]